MEIRALVAQLGSSGRTVLVSSHLLSEIEAVCDHLVVIRFGELLYSGAITGLLAGAGRHVDVRAEHDTDTDALAYALREHGWEVSGTKDGALRVSANVQNAASVNRAATAAGITLRSLTVTQESLGEVFLAMTGDTAHDVSATR